MPVQDSSKRWWCVAEEGALIVSGGTGSSSTLPAFVNRPDGLQHDLVRYKNGWKQVAAGSPAPRARAHHPLVYSEGWNTLFVYGAYTNDAVNTAYELYIFGGATAEFAPVLLNDLWRLTIPL